MLSLEELDKETPWELACFLVLQKRVTSAREYKYASGQNLISKICCERQVCTWEKAQTSSTDAAGFDPALCLSAP